MGRERVTKIRKRENKREKKRERERKRQREKERDRKRKCYKDEKRNKQTLTYSESRLMGSLWDRDKLILINK